MLRSMTGFGRCDTVLDGFHIQIQMKSVNHRYSDFTIKTPRYYTFLEDKLRNLAMASIQRGKVEIQLSLEREESDDKVITLDRPVAEGYLNALKELEGYGLKNDLTLSSMVSFHDIFHVEHQEIDEEQIASLVAEGFSMALAEFVEMRETEGARLESSLRSHLDALLQEVAAVEELSPQSVEAYRTRLKNKLEEVLSSTAIDESRILTEAAIFADKIAVDEETVRLRSHVKAFLSAMDTDKPIGKKLDFIVQEMNRETNTIGSKCNDLTVSAHVVEMKSIIEKIREQIQNIE
ncbi:MAG: YicC family protein [Clostridia bacterium]|nr:YicC family protein [Clostridia bacterium]